MPKAEKKRDLTKKVMEQIHKGQVKMHPHIYFVIGSLLLGIGLAGAVASTILFINLALFRLRTHAPFGFLRFGEFGLRPFFATFPWLPLFVAAIGFAGAAILLRHYEISYKKGFVGLVVGLLALVLTTGLLLDSAGFNERVGQFRPLGPLYQGPFYQGPFHREPFYQEPFAGEDWVAGEVLKVGDKEIVVSTPAGKEVTIVWDKTTRLPLGSNFAVGDRVQAVGQWQDEDTFVAKGIGLGDMRWRTLDDRVRGIRDYKMPKP